MYAMKMTSLCIVNNHAAARITTMFIENGFVCKNIDTATRLVTEVPCSYPKLRVSAVQNEPDLGSKTTRFVVLPNTKVPLSSSINAAAGSNFQANPVLTPEVENANSDVIVVGGTTDNSSFLLTSEPNKQTVDAIVRFSSDGISLSPKIRNACNSNDVELVEPQGPTAVVVFDNRTGLQASVQFSNEQTYGPNAYDCDGRNAFELGPRQTHQYLASPSASFVVTLVDYFGATFSSPAIVPYGATTKFVYEFKNNVNKPFAVLTVPPMVSFKSSARTRSPNGIMNIVLNSVETTDYLFQTPFVAPSNAVVQPGMPTYQVVLITVFSILAAAGVSALLYSLLRKLTTTPQILR